MSYGKGNQRHSHLVDPEFLQLPPETEEYLNILVNTCDALGLEESSFGSIFSVINRLSSEELSLRQNVLKLQSAENDLRDNLTSAKYEEALIHSWNEELGSPSRADESLTALERRKNTLNAKAKEYQKDLEKVKVQMTGESETTLSELSAYKDRLRKKEHELKNKRAKIQSFQGLPPNLDLARLELQKVRDEQMKLIQLRERLLRSMASGVM